MDRDRLKERLVARKSQIRTALDGASGEAKAALLVEFNRLGDLLDDVILADADQLAKDIKAAAAALDEVRTAHPLDALSVLIPVIDGLRADAEALIHPSAAAAPPAAPAPPTPASTAPPPMAAATQVFKTSSAKSFGQLKDEYAELFGKCLARPQKRGEIDRLAQRIRDNRARYEAVGNPLGIPWQIIGIIHALEANLSFSTHLHNGDSLTARTTQVPAGRPATGSPPFTWEQSAVDALKLEELDRNTDWSMEKMLFLLERFNGLGYRKLRVPSPYLWSFSNIYERGKFVRDREFDPDAVSNQCGAALLLKALA